MYPSFELRRVPALKLSDDGDILSRHVGVVSFLSYIISPRPNSIESPSEQTRTVKMGPRKTYLLPSLKASPCSRGPGGVGELAAWSQEVADGTDELGGRLGPFGEEVHLCRRGLHKLVVVRGRGGDETGELLKR